MFQIEQLAKSIMAFQAGTVVDFVAVKPQRSPEFNNMKNFSVESKGLPRGLAG